MPGLGGNPLLVLGLTAQALFGLRTGLQWLLSERAGESLIPRSYWWLSVVATVLLMVYAASTRDPVFLLGPVFNLAIYLRNLWLTYRPRQEGTGGHVLMVALAAGAVVAGTLLLRLAGGELGLRKVVLPWLLVGLTGQALWLSRYPVQWWISERRGESILPPAFFWISTVGAVLLCAYSVYHVDWVFILAYSLNPIPSTRNLLLIYRKRRAAEPVGAHARPDPVAVEAGSPAPGLLARDDDPGGARP